MNMLIIDDAKGVSPAMIKSLADEQFNVCILENLAHLPSYCLDDVDCILLEFSLPDADGIEALDALEQKSFEGNLLLKSPYGQASKKFFAEYAMELGFHVLSCLSSSCTTQQLLQQLDEIKKNKTNKNLGVSKKHLIEAFEEDQFELVYQPQYNLLTKECVGLEALARWHSPKLGSISPTEFVAKIDKYDLHSRFNQWLFNQALKEVMENQLADYRLAFNLSVNHLNDLSTAQLVLNTLSYYAADRELITIEITEDTVMQGNFDCKRALHLLKSAGIKISLDDFGTGFSSLQQLLEFQFDELKLDRCFSTNCQTDLKSKTILEMVLTLSSKFSLPLVIEGIEDSTQEQFITRLGGLIGQGFHYCKPLPAQQLKAFLASENNAVEQPYFFSNKMVHAIK